MALSKAALPTPSGNTARNTPSWSLPHQPRFLKLAARQCQQPAPPARSGFADNEGVVNAQIRPRVCDYHSKCHSQTATGAPQPPRPIHRSLTAFLPGPHDFEDASPGNLIRIGQLCDVCGVVRGWMVHRTECLAEPGDRPMCSQTEGDGIPHYKTVAELEESYQSGCHMCTQVWTSLLWHPDGEIGHLRLSGKMSLQAPLPRRDWPECLKVVTHGPGTEWIGNPLMLGWVSDNGDGECSQTFALTQSAAAICKRSPSISSSRLGIP